MKDCYYKYDTRIQKNRFDDISVDDKSSYKDGTTGIEIWESDKYTTNIN